MTFNSFFSGIGGFDLAFENAGMTPLFQCEKDSQASSVLKRYWPQVKNIGDIRNANKETITYADVFVGGFPCQDLSIAGKREGLAGERSGLFYEFARTIDEFIPDWFVAENVPGLLSSNDGKDFAIVIGVLTGCVPEIPVGGWKSAGLAWGPKYKISWRVLDAQFFGVPQRRRRVFIVGHSGDGRSAEVLFESESGAGDTQESKKPGTSITHAITASSSRSGRYDPSRETYIVGTLAAHSKRHGHAMTTQQAAESGHLIGIVEQNNSISTPDMISLRSNPAQPLIFDANRDGLTHGEGISLPLMHTGDGKSAHGAYQKLSILRNDHIFGVRRLTPEECEKLQGFPTGWTSGQSDSARYRQLGNAIAVPVGYWIGKRITEVENKHAA